MGVTPQNQSLAIKRVVWQFRHLYQQVFALFRRVFLSELDFPSQAPRSTRFAREEAFESRLGRIDGNSFPVEYVGLENLMKFR